jgi:hypothetical protein
MSAFLAWIIPQSVGSPEHPIVYPPNPSQPPGIWPSPGYPAHPIAPGGPPPGIWPGPGYPAHPIAPGGPPPGIWPSPGQPSHPIVYPPPPGIWPSPGHPEHPIVLPPPPGGGETGTPTNPINEPPTEVADSPGYWAMAYFPEINGWVWVWVPVDLPGARK